MIFFFYGPNTFAARRKIRDMIQAYVAKSGSDFGFEKIDGATVSFEVLGGSLTAMPFLAASRLIIIDSLSANKTVAEKFPLLLEQVPETTVAVLYEPSVDQRTSYFKTVSKATRAVRFDTLTPPQLAAWIKREVGALGATIDQAALSALIEAVGDDQWQMEQELNKLANFDPSITCEAVQKLVASSPTQSIFDLVDAMSGGQTAKALTIFRQLVAERTNELYILTMVTWQLRNLLLAKTYGGNDQAELARRAKLSPYVAAKALARQREFSLDKLKTSYVAAVETDYKIKSGKGNPEHLVEQLIYNVATA